jgi:hypothetical protein
VVSGLEIRHGLLDSGGLIRRLDDAKPLLLGCQPVDGPQDRLGGSGFLAIQQVSAASCVGSIG